MSARRALVDVLRQRPPATALEEAPRFWGRIGAYEAVSRHGMLFLLAPEPSHPSLRVKNSA